MNMTRLEELNQLIPPYVRDLLLDIANNSPDFNVYLGGGYLRDLFTGNSPKDIDIFMAPINNEVTLVSEFIPEGCTVNYRKRFDDEVMASDMEARGLQRLVGLWNTRVFSVQDLQYIIYKKPMSLREVAADFDMGICQIVYEPITDTIVYTDNFINGHTDKIIECFHHIDESRTVARFERMEKKFPSYASVGKPIRLLSTGGETLSRSHRCSV